MSATHDRQIQVDAEGRAYLEIRGLKFYLASDAEAEQSAAVICAPVSYFDDDVWTTCAHCGTRICHRPYMPVLPPKVCMACVRKTLKPPAWVTG